MYKKENKSWAKHLDFTLLDIACLQLAFLLSYFLRLGISLPYRNEQYQRTVLQISLRFKNYGDMVIKSPYHHFLLSLLRRKK